MKPLAQLYKRRGKLVPSVSPPHRNEWVRRTALAAGFALSTVAAVAIYQVAAPRQTPVTMATMLPQGALLTIESPDFATLLQSWNQSAEQKSWLASDNYSVFSNSRLFGRLNDARAEFEAAAKSSPNAAADINGDFLKQVAGKQSIFAWYDVGNLEFLYITRLSSSQAANIALLKDRARWTSRQSAGIPFYLRKSTDGPAAAAEEQAQSAQGRARTVAFAQVPDPAGDLLLLATREDLIANALALVRPATNAVSLANEPWYAEAGATLPQTNAAPALHMVLNLNRLVSLPAFRSYWVQQNVTAMKQYRAAVSDLYVEKSEFREERALLLNTLDDTPEAAPLASLAALAPATGVYRIAATSNPDAAVTALEEKLLGRMLLEATPETGAPDPTLEAAQSGSTSDLETRIDTPAPVSEAASNRALADALKAAGLDAMLTYSTAMPPASAAGLWVPIHSAVVLQATGPWTPQTLQRALQQSLRGNLTAATLGIEFRADTDGGQTIYTLTGPKALFFAVSGKLCFFSDDRDLLITVLRAAVRPAPAAPPAILIAGFDHASQRAPYARLTSLIDGTNEARIGSNQNHVQPPFFSGDMRSLSDTFAAVASERLNERLEGQTLRQTVIYQWHTP